MEEYHDSLEVLNGSGHLVLTWNPSVPEEVEKARAEVESLKAAGYTFYAVVGAQGDEIEAGDGQLIVERVSTPIRLLPPVGGVPKGKKGRKPKEVKPTGVRHVAVRQMQGG